MVGIAVPWYCPDYFGEGDDAIVIDAVLSSGARRAHERVRAREVYLSPWWCDMRWRERDGRQYATSAVITSADLVGSPRDKRARITSVVSAERMTDAQLEVQRRLDDYIAEELPSCIDILDAVDRRGRDALEPLWDLVSPIRTEWLTSGRAA